MVLRALLTAAGVSLLASLLFGAPPRDWQILVLHPDGAEGSAAFGAGGSLIVGEIRLPGVNGDHPALWNLEAGTLVDLLPPVAWYGEAYATDGRQQVGFASAGFSNPYTPMWSGTRDSFVDLHPGGIYYPGGIVYDVKAGQQVGYVVPPVDPHHAALWHGTPESFVDLHPPGAGWSEAHATDGVRQGGVATFPGLGNHRAVLWSGTAESCVHMNPPGSTESQIKGMAGEVQVGWGVFVGINHACLWKGTPESFVDMHPSVAYSSRLYDTTGRYHAGYITHGGLGQAGLWIGDDPESFIDLHAMLGPDWYFSVAYGIAEHNGKLHVVGRAGHIDGISRAVAWIARIPDTDRPPRRPPTSTPGQQTKPTSAGPVFP